MEEAQRLKVADLWVVNSTIDQTMTEIVYSFEKTFEIEAEPDWREKMRAGLILPS